MERLVYLGIVVNGFISTVKTRKRDPKKEKKELVDGWN